MTGVRICGHGVASSCCAHLLTAAGCPVSVEETRRATVPALLLSENTQRLLIDVFGRPGLFDGMPQIHRRVVAWGPNAETVALPHYAVAIPEEVLLQRLVWPTAADGEADWRILAARPLPDPVEEHAFGSRRASTLEVELSGPPDRETVWIESLPEGWLFVIPGAEGKTYLLAVGGAPETLLAQSRLLGQRIRPAAPAGGEFPVYPRIADPLCGPGWLACGTAALVFDPICGDGAGHAVREGILAAAVIDAARRGEPVDGLLQHYRARLVAGFERHLRLCREFYASGNAGPWWTHELDLLDRGLAWCRKQDTRSRYRLNGFQLLAIP